MSRTYSELERDQALAIFALESGREKVVTKVLAEGGLDIPFTTIRGWAYNSHKERYTRIKSEVEEYARAQLADRARGFAHLGGEVVEEALLQLRDKLEAGEIKAKELPKVVHEAAVAHGIGIDKSELLSGRPTSRVSTDLPGMLRELHDMGIEFIEGEAEEEAADSLPEPATSDLSQPQLPAGDTA